MTSSHDPIAVARRRLPAALGGALLVVIALVSIATPSRATYPEWEKYVDVEVIEIITEDEDGSIRETKIWFVLLSGVPFLRTSDSAWLANLRRNPDCGVRIEGEEFSVRATEIPGEEIVAKVDTASALKYGWQEKMIHMFRMQQPEVLELGPVPAAD